VSPEYIFEVSAQNTPQLIYYNHVKSSHIYLDFLTLYKSHVKIAIFKAGPKNDVLVYTTLNANELHIPALPLDEGVTCIPMAVGKQKG